MIIDFDIIRENGVPKCEKCNKDSFEIIRYYTDYIKEFLTYKNNHLEFVDSDNLFTDDSKEQYTLECVNCNNTIYIRNGTVLDSDY